MSGSSEARCFSSSLKSETTYDSRNDPDFRGAASKWPSSNAVACCVHWRISTGASFSAGTQITFAIGAGISGSIQLKHWNSAFTAPAIKQPLPNFQGRDVSKFVANLIGIENPGC